MADLEVEMTADMALLLVTLIGTCFGAGTQNSYSGMVR
jgi:hypothetical protein